MSYVILVGVLFEGIADYRRWKQDNKVNGQVVTRVAGQQNEKVLSMELLVGDIILVQNDEMLPADCVLVSTDDPLG